MLRVLIVDDETLVRVTLRGLVPWERYGFTVAGDCTNGLQALEQIRRRPVDLLIIDMKMPGMDGLTLLRRLRELGTMPVSVALSGYDEFELVREAFRLGVYDYLLKTDLNAGALGKLLENLRRKVFSDSGPLRLPAEEPADGALAPGEYCVVVFTLDDFPKQAVRFGGGLREKLQKPLMDLVRQLPMVAGRAVIASDEPGQYTLYWSVRDRRHCQGAIVSLTRQVQSVWRDYMNVSASAAVSLPVDAGAAAGAAALCRSMGKLAVLQGRGAVCQQVRWAGLARRYEREAASFDPMITTLMGGGKTDFELECRTFINRLAAQEEQDQTETIAILIARMNEKWNPCGEDFFRHFPETPGLWESLNALGTSAERILWLRNTLRRLRDALACGKEAADPMEKARLFLQDNFANPELNLRSVADYVGFNEKYFSTRFAKTFGCTFVGFLNRLRLDHARDLLLHTDMRIYEAAAAAGYRNVEHFNRVFKENLGTTPKEYRNQNRNSDKTSRNPT